MRNGVTATIQLSAPPDVDVVLQYQTGLLTHSSGRVACTQYIDAACCCQCVFCLSVTTVSCAKMAEAVEMPFGM